MHSESQIRKAVKILLEEYGTLNTSEVKQHLSEVLEFDEEDLQPSTTRNEVLIIQRIGNVVSHQNEQISLYDEGFIIDKRYNPAQWFTIAGINGNENVLSDDEINIRRSRMGNHNPHRYRKINWEQVNERQSFIGVQGEEFVFSLEYEFVYGLNPNLVSRVQHLSATQGDGFGYDILSIDEFGNSKYIEVKTTTSNDADAPFFMSENEREFFEQNLDNNAFIYRVFDFNPQTREGRIKIISARELFDDYYFDPISYKVTYKYM